MSIILIVVYEEIGHEDILIEQAIYQDYSCSYISLLYTKLLNDANINVSYARYAMERSSKYYVLQDISYFVSIFKNQESDKDIMATIFDKVKNSFKPLYDSTIWIFCSASYEIFLTFSCVITHPDNSTEAFEGVPLPGTPLWDKIKTMDVKDVSLRYVFRVSEKTLNDLAGYNMLSVSTDSELPEEIYMLVQGMFASVNVILSSSVLYQIKKNEVLDKLVLNEYQIFNF